MTSSVPEIVPRFITASKVFTGHVTADVAFRIQGESLRPVARDSVPPELVVAHIPGTVLPGFTDSHVHLALIDGCALNAGGIANVVDLGWDPAEVRSWSARGDSGDPSRSVGVEFVGALLTASGGYPLHSGWAPAEAVRVIRTADDAALVVAQMAELGASAVKIAFNSDVGPVFSHDLLVALVEVIHGHGLPAVVHAEGLGQAMRALRAGVDRFAHTPFSEQLTPDEICSMARNCQWISTLDIHGWGQRTQEFEIASDNLARFAAAGGTVLYGTDLGNGALAVGINVRELSALSEAGLGREKLMRALTPGESMTRRVSWIPDSAESTDDVLWLASAEVVSVTSLEERFA